MVRSHIISRLCLLVATTAVPMIGSSANAAVMVTTVNASFTTIAQTFDFKGGTFTFSGTGDIFNPVAVRTNDTGATRSFGGFLGIPVSPSTDFPDRGSGVLTYGPDTPFTSFTSPTTISYSNGENYIGLRVVENGVNYYGFAHTTDTTLDSYGFESTPNTAISLNTAVPEPATWATTIGGLGLVGGMMRLSRRPRERFTRNLRKLAAA